MFATPPLESFGSPKSTTSNESTFDSAASTGASSATTADDAPTTGATPTESSDHDHDHNLSSSLKRKRRCSSSALTPPLSTTSDANDDDGDDNTQTLTHALHVLATEAAALAHITTLYATSPPAQTALLAAVHLLARAHARGGKTIVCGVGKSGLVGRKTVATMKSLGLGASFLHAGEAVHGDLGDVRAGDVVMFVSFSGRTGELVGVRRQLAVEVPVVVVTGCAQGECLLVEGRGEAVVLPAGIRESEEASFGVGAPTTSTAVAMAVGDMLALAVAERVHGAEKARVFKRNHPGGAIGAKTAAEEEVEVTTVVTKRKKVCLEH